MGLFSKKVSPEVGALAALKEMDDEAIKRLLRDHKVKGYKGPKELRKAMDQVGYKGIAGEKGMGALLAGLAGGGTGNRNHQNIPAKDRMHPSMANREREALNAKVQAAIARGDRAEQIRLRQTAKDMGWLK
jgi:hypothetical protein